ncbi:hypothetical protein J437_LFUL018648 [Ladona fulva]|uniref:Ig-like domain-containing protein n=1 Tax=Ladona fulva TaxID=123851 RepID=A0A8K0KUA6_LADFU|nr:hypothetical protein J437_LFUL018648 [Ladona fulva]
MTSLFFVVSCAHLAATDANFKMTTANERINVAAVPHITPCPASCRCAYLLSAFSHGHPQTTDCSYQKLETVPNDIPHTTEALSLKGNMLKEMPDLLHLLSNLQELDLSGNRIKSLGRGALFQNMSSLHYLNLGKNELSTLFSDSFSGLEQLEILNLSENKITYIEDGAFGVLENLQRLSLDSNMIGSLYEEWFLGLKALVNLSLAHNIIHHINQNVFRAVTELKELILTGNRINGIEPLGFNGLHKLVTLNIDGNLLAAVPTSSLQTLPSLKYLKMDLNPISKLQAYSFSEIVAHEVSLHNLHDLRIVDGFAFHNMFNMTILRMHDNKKLSFVDPEAFANLTVLHKLYLHNNNLRGVSKRIMENLPSDVEITLYGNPLLCDCNMRWIRQEMVKSKNDYHVRFKDDNHIICDQPPENRLKVIKSMENRNIPKECAPTIIDFGLNKTLTRKLGDPLTMECRALGLPVPKLHWVLPDGTVLNSSSNSVRVRLRNPGTLIFYHLKATDSGRYTCVAENSMGVDDLSVTLKVTGIDIHLFPTGVSSTFVTLVWNGTARNAFPSYQILYQLVGDAKSDSNGGSCNSNLIFSNPESVPSSTKSSPRHPQVDATPEVQLRCSPFKSEVSAMSVASWTKSSTSARKGMSEGAMKEEGSRGPCECDYDASALTDTEKVLKESGEGNSLVGVGLVSIDVSRVVNKTVRGMVVGTLMERQVS